MNALSASRPDIRNGPNQTFFRNSRYERTVPAYVVGILLLLDAIKLAPLRAIKAMQQYHRESGNRSSRDMSGSIIHRLLNSIDKQWDETISSFRNVRNIQNSSILEKFGTPVCTLHEVASIKA